MDVGAWIPVLHRKYRKAVLKASVMAQGLHCSLPPDTSPGLCRLWMSAARLPWGWWEDGE